MSKYGSSIDDATLAVLRYDYDNNEVGSKAPDGSTASGVGEFEISNYPNPFNPTTTMTFTLPEEGRVTLKVYDMLGRVVADLINQTMKAGKHQTTFDGSKLPSGVYFYRLTTDGLSLTKKFVLAK